MQYYVVRVDFPDEDQYVFVTCASGVNQGDIQKFYRKEDAEAVAKNYQGGIVLCRENGKNDTN